LLDSILFGQKILLGMPVWDGQCDTALPKWTEQLLVHSIASNEALACVYLKCAGGVALKKHQYISISRQTQFTYFKRRN
jgi:hypothetical protein